MEYVRHQIFRSGSGIPDTLQGGLYGNGIPSVPDRL